MGFSDLISKLNEKNQFKKVCIDQTVIDSVVFYAKKSYPDDDEVFEGGLHGVEHALIGLFPLQVMCDRFDIGGMSTAYHKDTEKATIFIYDGYEGGIGICEKAVDVFVELLESTLDLIKNCKCRNGCPSCIYSPKCGNDNKPLHKKATEYILQYMLDETQKNNSKVVTEEVIVHDDNLYAQALDFYTQHLYSQAKDLLHEILNDDANNLNANLLMAHVLYEQGIEDVATYYARKALKISPSNTNAAALLQKLQFVPAKIEFTHNVEKKEENFQEVGVDKSFDDVDTLYEEAYDLFNQGDLDTAKELLEELLAIDDTHVEATALMGFVYRRGGIFPKAVEYARKASKLDKNNAMVRELIKELS